MPVRWQGHGRGELAACVEAVDGLKARLARLAPGLVRPAEPLKLVLDANALGRSGRALADLLRAHKVECEYADGQYVVLMFRSWQPPRWTMSGWSRG